MLYAICYVEKFQKLVTSHNPLKMMLLIMHQR